MASRIIPTDTKTIKVVLLSLLAATTFWFLNALNKDYSATIYYPIEFDYDKNEYIATEDLPDEVQVNVSGGGWSILRTGYLGETEPILYPVQNPEQTPKVAGAALIGPISESLLELELNYVLEDSLFLSIEKITTKKVIVLVDSLGVDLSKDHYIVSEVVCDTDTVELSGPRSMIHEFPDTAWIRIDDRRVDSNFDRDVEIGIYNDLITPSQSTGRVTFDVEEFVQVSRRIPLTKWNFPEDSTIVLADSTIGVQFQIRESRATQFENDEFSIVVDYNKMVTYDSTIQALIMKYPLDIRDLDILSSRAKVVRKLEE